MVVCGGVCAAVVEGAAVVVGAAVVGAVVAAAEDAFAALCVSDAAAEDWAMEVSASRIEDASSGV